MRWVAIFVDQGQGWALGRSGEQQANSRHPEGGSQCPTHLALYVAVCCALIESLDFGTICRVLVRGIELVRFVVQVEALLGQDRTTTEESDTDDAPRSDDLPQVSVSRLWRGGEQDRHGKGDQDKPHGWYLPPGPGASGLGPINLKMKPEKTGQPLKTSTLTT